MPTIQYFFRLDLSLGLKGNDVSKHVLEFPPQDNVCLAMVLFYHRWNVFGYSNLSFSLPQAETSREMFFSVRMVEKNALKGL